MENADSMENFSYVLFVVTSPPNGGWHDIYGVFDTKQEALDHLGYIDIEYVSAHIVELPTAQITWEGHL